MTIRVGILGSSGYGGAELVRRLLHHSQVEITALGSRQYLGQKVASAWPQLVGRLEHLTFQDNDAVIEGCDVVFCATPHGATARLVKQALDAGREVIDLSADFRLPMDVYKEWYGPHPHPEVYALARYGLVELHRDELQGARLLAVPGCNSSAAIIALAPLAATGLLGPDIVANIATGVSGAGRAAALGFHFPETNENVKPYKVAGSHRHTAEIELTLGRLAQQGKQLETHSNTPPLTVSFNPHLVPMTRGILATCYTKPRDAPSEEELFNMYRSFYEPDPLVSFQEDLPQTKAVYGSDRTVVSVRVDKRSGHVVAFAALDNLGKGAAGQAIQGFNVVHGFDETQGLVLSGLWP